jgi:Transposase zinc-ribbon domain
MPDLPGDFSDERSCGEYLIALRWPSGFTCYCGSRRGSRLRDRANTFECLDCGRQTSVTAGTMMNRTRLSLGQWLMAVRLFADRGGPVPAVHLRRSLGISRGSAALLKSKLDRLVEDVQEQMLEGPVLVLVGRLSSFTGDPCTLIAVREQSSGLARAAIILDASTHSIEKFLLDRVKPGATLYFPKNAYRTLAKYRAERAVEDEWQKTFSFLKDIVRQSAKLMLDEIEGYVDRRVTQLNKSIGARPSFETLLRLIVIKEPMSHWDMIEVQNPRAGKPTVRRSTRRRKTPDGMRQDGARRRSNAPEI